MLNLIRYEFQYNISSVFFAALLSVAAMLAIKMLSLLNLEASSSIIANLYIILIVGNTIKLISEKRTRMQMVLNVSPFEIAIARLGFIVCFQLALTIVLITTMALMQPDFLLINPMTILFVNFQLLIISTFIMLHNGLGFLDKFKYRVYLYLTPVALIALVIIFWESLAAYFEANPMPEYFSIALSAGVWLTMAAIYVISVVEGKIFTE